MIRRERGREGKGVGSMGAWKCGLCLGRDAYIARPWTGNGVLESEWNGSRYDEDQREDKRFFTGTCEIQRDRDKHHEDAAAHEREPQKQRVKKAAVVECSDEMSSVVLKFQYLFYGNKLSDFYLKLKDGITGL